MLTIWEKRGRKLKQIISKGRTRQRKGDQKLKRKESRLLKNHTFTELGYPLTMHNGPIMHSCQQELRQTNHMVFETFEFRGAETASQLLMCDTDSLLPQKNSPRLSWHRGQSATRRTNAFGKPSTRKNTSSISNGTLNMNATPWPLMFLVVKTWNVGRNSPF